MSLLAAAIAANVDWCDRVCRARGVRTVSDGELWWTTDPSPWLYPDLITIRPGSTRVPEVLRQGADRSVKDSHAQLDLSTLGLEVLFDATWIGRAPSPAEGGGWSVVDLVSWQAAAGVPDSITAAAVEADEVAVLGLERSGTIVGGAIANRCGEVVGISNVFAVDDPGEVWATLAPAVAALVGPLPLVGYEQAADLEAAKAAGGFDELGPLRVWIDGGATAPAP